MTSIDYDEIYSVFYTKVEAYDILELGNDELEEFLCNWLHSAAKKPYIRRLFTILNCDNEIQELSFEIKYSVDEGYDVELIIEVLALGMIVEWITPKINSLSNIAQMFGSKEEKFFSQSAHLKELKDLKASILREQRNIIRDRGYIWNSYLDGES